MRIREDHPLTGDLIHVRGLNLAPLRVQDLDITITHIICVDDDDVRLLLRCHGGAVAPPPKGE